MKWISHTAIGCSYVYISGHSEPLVASAIIAGSVFPDVVDRFISMGDQKLWDKVHRKLSHWWLVYIAFIFLLLQMDNYLCYLGYFLAVGSLLHIYSDMVTYYGVPFLNPFRADVSLKFNKTGSLKEIVAVTAFIFLIFVLNFIPIPLWVSLTLIFLLIAVGKPKTKRENHKLKKDVALSELSKIWTNQDIKLPKIAPLKEQPKPSGVVQPLFKHDDLILFYDQNVRNLPEASVKVITEVLNLLDEHGDCPSVVRRSGEPNDYPQNTFDILAKVPLWEHSLHVAHEILKSVENPGAYAAPLLLSALGHDLGKMQGFDKAMYSMGDHPKISIVALNSIPGFDSLPYKDDVEQAILNHHRTGGGDLADYLREADRNARKKELGTYFSLLPAKNLNENEEENPESETKQNLSAALSTERIYVSVPETKVEKKPKENSELGWINVSALIKELNSKINVLNGERFDAFSMQEGYVFFQTDVFWRVIKKMAREGGHEHIMLAENDQKLRRDYIFTTVSMLRENNFIAEGLIQNGYFTAPFIVTFKDGTKINKAYYTPLVSEAFGDVSELESRKTGKLLEIISVEPKYSEDKP
jgi:membrane-bound metal-dependent hydrolase YbcI (DUF457 family)